MSMKTTFLTFAFALLVLPTAGHTAEDNGGFGSPFTNEGHAGFETPMAYEDTPSDVALDGSALQDIEPAAGDEATDVDAEIMHDEIHMNDAAEDVVTEDIVQ